MESKIHIHKCPSMSSLGRSSRPILSIDLCRSNIFKLLQIFTFKRLEEFESNKKSIKLIVRRFCVKNCPHQRACLPFIWVFNEIGSGTRDEFTSNTTRPRINSPYKRELPKNRITVHYCSLALTHKRPDMTRWTRMRQQSVKVIPILKAFWLFAVVSFRCCLFKQLFSLFCHVCICSSSASRVAALAPGRPGPSWLSLPRRPVTLSLRV